MNMKKIEKKLTEKTIYDGRILRLHVDEIELPNGKTSIRECVAHKAAVGILPLVEDCFVFVKQQRYAVGKFLTEIPAGLMEAGENPETTAARELQEEIGLRPLNLKLLGTVYPSPGFTDEKTTIYFATRFEAHQLKADDDEFIEIIRIPVDTVRMLYRHGFFEDAKTVCALGYYFSLYDR